MKLLICFLFFPAFLPAQTNDGRQVVAVTINYEPDEIESPNEYYLIADIPAAIKLNPGQTFLLQSTWQKEGDSVVNIGAGTVRSTQKNSAELIATIYPGRKVKKGDMAMFLVSLIQPGKDSLFFKLARYDISFTTVEESLFYERHAMLENPANYPAGKLLDAMAEDIRYTGKAMTDMKNSQDTKVVSGVYKGQMIFAMMQKATAGDVLQFIRYVYARPDKYKAHVWKISETFATWVISGAPVVK